MPPFETAALNATFAALADPTRRAIISQLASGEAALGRLTTPHEMSQTGVSKHIGVLADAGLVIVEKRGRTRFCRLNPAPMKTAAEWIEFYRDFWEIQFNALAAFLEADEHPTEEDIL